MREPHDREKNTHKSPMECKSPPPHRDPRYRIDAVPVELEDKHVKKPCSYQSANDGTEHEILRTLVREVVDLLFASGFSEGEVDEQHSQHVGEGIPADPEPLGELNEEGIDVMDDGIQRSCGERRRVGGRSIPAALLNAEGHSSLRNLSLLGPVVWEWHLCHPEDPTAEEVLRLNGSKTEGGGMRVEMVAWVS